VVYPFRTGRGANYQIKITSTTNPEISDMSNAFFKIAKLPVITVTSPNGGETWQAGTTQTITWTYTGKPDPYVKIDLYSPGLLYRSITSSTSIGSGGSGSYNWAIPPTTPVGTDYRVIITSTTNTAISDLSDANFSIGLAGAPGVEESCMTTIRADLFYSYWIRSNKQAQR